MENAFKTWSVGKLLKVSLLKGHEPQQINLFLQSPSKLMLSILLRLWWENMLPTKITLGRYAIFWVSV